MNWWKVNIYNPLLWISVSWHLLAPDAVAFLSQELKVPWITWQLIIHRCEVKRHIPLSLICNCRKGGQFCLNIWQIWNVSCHRHLTWTSFTVLVSVTQKWSLARLLMDLLQRLWGMSHTQGHDDPGTASTTQSSVIEKAVPLPRDLPTRLVSFPLRRHFWEPHID